MLNQLTSSVIISGMIKLETLLGARMWSSMKVSCTDPKNSIPKVKKFEVIPLKDLPVIELENDDDENRENIASEVRNTLEQPYDWTKKI